MGISSQPNTKDDQNEKVHAIGRSYLPNRNSGRVVEVIIVASPVRILPIPPNARLHCIIKKRSAINPWQKGYWKSGSDRPFSNYSNGGSQEVALSSHRQQPSDGEIRTRSV